MESMENQKNEYYSKLLNEYLEFVRVSMKKIESRLFDIQKRLDNLERGPIHHHHYPLEQRKDWPLPPNQLFYR